MECIVGEDFDMECGICLEECEYSFQAVDFREYPGDSLMSPSARAAAACCNHGAQ